MLAILFTFALARAASVATTDLPFRPGRFAGWALQTPTDGDSDDIRADLEVSQVGARTFRIYEQTLLPGIEDLTTFTFEVTLDESNQLSTRTRGLVAGPIGACGRSRCTWTLKFTDGTARRYVMEFTSDGVDYTIVQFAPSRHAVWTRDASLGPKSW